MATLVNANFWIYFIGSKEEDRVICKICKKSLKSKRSFNLRSHLKQSHKIEVRHEKRCSMKQQQLTSSSEVTKGDNLWACFTSCDRDDRVACKICAKTLNSNNDSNLRQHLKITHKIEVRSEKRLPNKNKDQLLPCLKESASFTSRIDEKPSMERKNARYEATNIQKFDSNDSYSGASSPTIMDIKNEVLQDAPEKEYIDTMEREISFEVNTLENADNVERSIQNPPNPLAMTRQNGSCFDDPLNDSDMLTNSEEFRQRSNKKMTRLDELLEKSKNSNGNGYFEEWIKKKNQLLEIEEFEMRNYKLKLELWEKEQQLQLTCSKFTKDIKSNI